MSIIIRGHGTHVTPPLRTYAQKKFEKLPQFFENIQKVEITLDARTTSNIKRNQVAEVTVWVAGLKVIRATEAGQDMYAAIDLVYDEIRRQINKHKEKHRDERRRIGEKSKEKIQSGYLPASSGVVPKNGAAISKVNRFADKPLRENEALEEFQLMRQDFLMFKNADIGEISLVCLKNQKPQVVTPKRLPSFTPDEARGALSKKKVTYLAFKNADTQKTNVIYKRQTGNFGLVEPRF